MNQGVTKLEHDQGPEVDSRTENALQPEDNGTLWEGSKQGKNLVKFYNNNNNNNNIYHLSSTCYISTTLLSALRGLNQSIITTTSLLTCNITSLQMRKLQHRQME